MKSKTLKIPFSCGEMKSECALTILNARDFDQSLYLDWLSAEELEKFKSMISEKARIHFALGRVASKIGLGTFEDIRPSNVNIINIPIHSKNKNFLFPGLLRRCTPRNDGVCEVSRPFAPLSDGDSSVFRHPEERYPQPRHPEERSDVGIQSNKIQLSAEIPDRGRLSWKSNIGIGSPAIENFPYGLSISHSNDAIAALVFKEEFAFGIDIEYSRKDRLETLQHVNLADKASIPNDLKSLTVAWTLKEGLAKALKCGFTVPFEEFEICNFLEKEDTYECEFSRYPEFKGSAIFHNNESFAMVYEKKCIFEDENFLQTQLKQLFVEVEL